LLDETFSMTSEEKVKPLPNMDEKKHKIMDKHTISLLKVSDIETEAPPSLPFPANPYRS